ncbi:hypothetical protein [Halarcobacter sp.]|uniref:hypothetical protein n=1 Tax=Halarcobacter sp. TaxID=2321133 RepID=UPI0029F4A5E7|nr:hypothetical protein [Halarcobacter sp.]
MSSDEKVLFETLYSKYKKIAISKKEMSLETGQSISTLDRLRKSGLGCAYIKKGNGDIFYPLTELAKYYTRVVQTI